MIFAFNGDQLIAHAWQLSLHTDEWVITSDGARYETTRAGVEVFLTRLEREIARQHGFDDHGREDPETGEPLPSYTSGFALGAGPGRAAVSA